MTTEGYRGHTRFDRTQMCISIDHPMSHTKKSTWEGEEYVYFEGFAKEIWHRLTRVLSWPALLFTLLVVEIAKFGIDSALLTLVAVLQGAHPKNMSPTEIWGQKLLLCTASMRLNSDTIYGFNPSAPSTNAEIIVLSIACWFHWVMLTINAAIVVARALLPIQQLVFAPGNKKQNVR